MGNRRRKLIQNYEDAKLALLLDEYAEVYGRISTEQYEKDLADGKIKKISDQEAAAELNEILRRAEEEEAKESRISRRFKGAARKIATVAASIAIFFTLMVTVQAAGIDVFGAVGRWTDSLFHFEAESGVDVNQKSDVKSMSSSTAREMRKTISLNGFPIDLAPSWIPDGLSISGMSLPENADYKGISFYLESPSGDWLLMQIDVAATTGAFGAEWIEKDNDIVDTVQSNDRTYYIFKNDGVWTGIFQSETYRITITGSREKDELIQIIHSIGEKNND